MTLEEKLALFDKYAGRALEDVVDMLHGEKEQLVSFARGRHIWGHHRYGDRNFLEWDDGQMQAAIREELADAVVYQAKVLADRAAKLG